jgi:phage FluMu protein Com
MDDRIAVSCEHCGGKFKAKAIAAGRKIACPKCKESITVPLIEEPAQEDSLGNFADEGFAAFPSLDLPAATPEQVVTMPSVPTALPEPAPYQPPITNKRTGAKGTRENFTALKILALIFKVLGLITGIVGLIFQFPFLLVAMAAGFSGTEGGAAIMVMFVCGIIANLVIWTFLVIVQFAIGELIELAIQIEYNTSRK